MQLRQRPSYWQTCPSRSRNAHAISVKVQSEFFVAVSRRQKLNLLYCCRQLTASIVVSAMAVFRLGDNLMPLAVFTLFTDLITNSNRDTGSFTCFWCTMYYCIDNVCELAIRFIFSTSEFISKARQKQSQENCTLTRRQILNLLLIDSSKNLGLAKWEEI